MSGIVDFRTEIEDENGQAITEANPFPVTSQGLQVMQRIAALLKPLQQITGGGSNRLSVDVNSGTVTANQGGTWNIATVTTVTGVTTVSTLSSITNYANVWAFDQNRAMSRTAYATSVRPRIA